jgi:hypothetical protein
MQDAIYTHKYDTKIRLGIFKKGNKVARCYIVNQSLNFCPIQRANSGKFVHNAIICKIDNINGSK